MVISNNQQGKDINAANTRFLSDYTTKCLNTVLDNMRNCHWHDFLHKLVNVRVLT